MLHSLKRTVTAVTVALMAACGTGGESNTTPPPAGQTTGLTSVVHVGGINPLTAFTGAVLAGQNLPGGLGSSLGGGVADIAPVFTLIQTTLGPYIKYLDVQMYRVQYRIPGYDEALSGLVAVPTDLLGRSLTLPVLSLQHPTQVRRSQSPSLVSLYQDEQLTVPLGAIAAAMGYIVVIPDYQGMGVNRDTHPYCLTSLAKGVTGLIKAATAGTAPWSSKTTWDGRLYLMGYSEGAYATLVTAKELQQQRPAVPVHGVAALDGPYSLSGTMRELLLNSDATFASPYFLPYLIAGYSGAYGGTVPAMEFTAAIKGDRLSDGTPLNLTLYPMLSGSSTAEEINEVMRQVVPYGGPGSILTTSFLAALQDQASGVYSALQGNDAFRGWMPGMPVRLFHNPADDLVPVGNMYEVKSAWQGLQNVTYAEYTDAIPGLGSVHAGSMIPAYLKGITWIDALANPQRH